MPLMVPKKDSVQVILNKLRGSNSSTSEHSSDAIKQANEKSTTVDTNEHGDEVNSTTAMDAAAQSAMTAMESKDIGQFKSAISDMFQLLSMAEEDSEQQDPNVPESY